MQSRHRALIVALAATAIAATSCGTETEQLVDPLPTTSTTSSLPAPTTSPQESTSTTSTPPSIDEFTATLDSELREYWLATFATFRMQDAAFSGGESEPASVLVGADARIAVYEEFADRWPAQPEVADLAGSYDAFLQAGDDRTEAFRTALESLRSNQAVFEAEISAGGAPADFLDALSALFLTGQPWEDACFTLQSELAPLTSETIDCVGSSAAQAPAPDFEAGDTIRIDLPGSSYEVLAATSTLESAATSGTFLEMKATGEADFFDVSVWIGELPAVADPAAPHNDRAVINRIDAPTSIAAWQAWADTHPAFNVGDSGTVDIDGEQAGWMDITFDPAGAANSLGLFVVAFADAPTKFGPAAVIGPEQALRVVVVPTAGSTLTALVTAGERPEGLDVATEVVATLRPADS